MTKVGVVGTPAAGETAGALRSLLALDRSLTPSDRVILERLLLAPGPATARELARVTGANVQSLYLTLDRLERRGLLVRERHSGGMTFRSGHPTAVLHELLGDWRQVDELAQKVEGPLRQIHEGPREDRVGANGGRLWTTSSLTAMLGALLHQLRTVRDEVWVVGREDPWCTVSTSVLHELVRLSSRVSRLDVRVLVDALPANATRRATWERLRAAGIPLRSSNLFTTPMMILDRRWICFSEDGRADPTLASPHYVSVESAGLGADLTRACVAAWARSRDPLATGSAPSGRAGEKDRAVREL